MYLCSQISYAICKGLIATCNSPTHPDGVGTCDVGRADRAGWMISKRRVLIRRTYSRDTPHQGQAKTLYVYGPHLVARPPANNPEAVSQWASKLVFFTTTCARRASGAHIGHPGALAAAVDVNAMERSPRMSPPQLRRQGYRGYTQAPAGSLLLDFLHFW